MFYRGKYADGGDGREMGLKRQRVIDQGSSFYGTSPNYGTSPGYGASPAYGASQGSSFMYNPPSYSYVGQPPPFPVVRLRGLPFDCSEADIAEFFHGLDIVDVLFVNKSGKFTGDAYCVLGYPLQVDFALQRNRQNMGRRYVEVFRSKRQEYYKAIANEVSDSRGGSPPHRSVRAKSSDDGRDSAEHTGVLRLRGLPFSASKDDIMDFFKDFVLSEDSIHFTMNSEGRRTGEAFVEFASAEDSKAAMVKDRKTLGSRYIELFPSSHEEWEEAASRGRFSNTKLLNSIPPRRPASAHACNHQEDLTHFRLSSSEWKRRSHMHMTAERSSTSNNPRSSNDGDEPAEPTEVLRMRGLPFSAGKDDIMDFFKDYALTDDSIHMTVNSSGRLTGEAFVEFANVEDAKSALSKDRMTLGSRYIELFMSSVEELKEAVSRGR
ncbi:hypothetical protein LguiA_013315 [Lonicera macranthoides]